MRQETRNISSKINWRVFCGSRCIFLAYFNAVSSWPQIKKNFNVLSNNTFDRRVEGQFSRRLRLRNDLFCVDWDTKNVNSVNQSIVLNKTTCVHGCNVQTESNRRTDGTASSDNEAHISRLTSDSQGRNQI